MVNALMAVVFLLTWVGSTLLIDALLERRDRPLPDLTQRLLPFAGEGVAQEAERWLSGR